MGFRENDLSLHILRLRGGLGKRLYGGKQALGVDTGMARRVVGQYLRTSQQVVGLDAGALGGTVGEDPFGEETAGRFAPPDAIVRLREVRFLTEVHPRKHNEAGCRQSQHYCLQPIEKARFHGGDNLHRKITSTSVAMCPLCTDTRGTKRNQLRIREIWTSSSRKGQQPPRREPVDNAENNRSYPWKGIEVWQTVGRCEEGGY
jgi:hypothetical protein